MQQSWSDTICTILYLAFKSLHLNIRIFSREHLNGASSPKKDMTWHWVCLKHSRAHTLLLGALTKHSQPSSSILLIPSCAAQQRCSWGESQGGLRMHQHLKSIIKLCTLGLNEIYLLFLFNFFFLNGKSYQGVICSLTWWENLSASARCGVPFGELYKGASSSRGPRPGHMM